MVWFVSFYKKITPKLRRDFLLQIVNIYDIIYEINMDSGAEYVYREIEKI